jgi:hyperosmotically inducible protein
MRITALPALLTLGLLFPAASVAQTTDEQLGERVARSIRSYAHFTIFDDVEISVDNRNVVLRGRVTTPIKRKDIGERVEKIDGVAALTNDIGVLPLSPADQRLRVRIANAIYNNPAFWRYAQMANPSIHIIVEDGRVTLTGVVDSNTDKALAYSLSQVDGIFGVTNRLRVSSR